MTFTPIVFGSGVPGFTFLNASRATQQTAFDRSPVVSTNVEAFRERIQNIQTSAQLTSDRQVLTVALGAFGLDDDIDNSAFIQRVLESDLTSPASFANRLNDPRYQALARTFGFASSDGPRIDPVLLGDGLDEVETADELLSNPRLLRNALERFNLEGNEGNTFFLQRVLESDLTDPDSFVNGLNRPDLLAFASAFDFAAKAAPETPLKGFVAAFDGAFESLSDAEDLLSNPELLEAATNLFGLERTDERFLRSVLNSDPTDDGSLVQQLDDKRYQAFSEAFGFGWPNINDLDSPDQLINNEQLLEDALATFDVVNPGNDRLRDILASDLDDPGSVANQPVNAAYLDMAKAFESNWPKRVSFAETFVTALSDEVDNINQGSDVIFDLDVFDATADMFGLSDRKTQLTFLQQIIDSNPNDATSLSAQHPDKRLQGLAAAFGLNTATADQRVYPEGFADSITRGYLDRQFEIGIGAVDLNMRLALSLERELTGVSERGGTQDGRWFGLMGSGPLRQVFETVFQLPAGFGNLDIDQQLDVFKSRSRDAFGTDEVNNLLEPETLDDIRQRFLAFGQFTGATGAASSGTLALSLLSG